MKVHCNEGVAIRIGPEPCVGIREDDGEASIGEYIGVAKAQQTYGVKYPSDYLNTKHGQLKDADWVLSFKAPRVASIGWMHVDFVIPVTRSDKAAFENDYPFQAVQANPTTSYRPPFKLDPAFRDAFKRAMKEFGVEKLDALWRRPPPKFLLDLIARNMAT